MKTKLSPPPDVNRNHSAEPHLSDTNSRAPRESLLRPARREREKARPQGGLPVCWGPWPPTACRMVSTAAARKRTLVEHLPHSVGSGRHWRRKHGRVFTSTPSSRDKPLAPYPHKGTEPRVFKQLDQPELESASFPPTRLHPSHAGNLDRSDGWGFFLSVVSRLL